MTSFVLPLNDDSKPIHDFGDDVETKETEWLLDLLMSSEKTWCQMFPRKHRCIAHNMRQIRGPALLGHRHALSRTASPQYDPVQRHRHESRDVMTHETSWRRQRCSPKPWPKLGISFGKTTSTIRHYQIMAYSRGRSDSQWLSSSLSSSDSDEDKEDDNHCETLIQLSMRIGKMTCSSSLRENTDVYICSEIW